LEERTKTRDINLVPCNQLINNLGISCGNVRVLMGFSGATKKIPHQTGPQEAKEYKIFLYTPLQRSMVY